VAGLCVLMGLRSRVLASRTRFTVVGSGVYVCLSGKSLVEGGSRSAAVGDV